MTATLEEIEVADVPELSAEERASRAAEHMHAAICDASSFLGEAAEMLPVAEEMDSKYLVTVLVGMKSVQKKAKTVEDAIKALITGRHKPKTEAGTPKNEKVFVDGENGARIELRPKRTVSLNVEKAVVGLKAKGLYEAALTRRTVVVDPVALFTKLKDAQVALMTAGCTELAIDIGVVLKTAVHEEVTLTEDGIGALVGDEKISLDDVSKFYDEKVDHSVYDASK